MLFGLEFIYDGFYELGRVSGMGLGPILYSEQSVFLHDHSIDPSGSFGTFIRRLWRQMDPVYLEETEKRQEIERKRKPKSAPRSSPTMGRK